MNNENIVIKSVSKKNTVKTGDLNLLSIIIPGI